MWQLKTINDDTLQDFYTQFLNEKTFLQSVPYAQLRRTLGEEILQFGVFQANQLIGVVLIQITQTKLKRFAHIPHGPLVKDNSPEFWTWFLEEYIRLGREKNCDFVRISSLLAPPQSALLQNTGFRPAPTHLVNPEKTWVLPLQKTEEELLADMKKSTRYEVRKGLKTNFEVNIGNDKKSLDTFWELHLETVKRQGFVPFSRKLTEAELKTFGDKAQIITISHENQALASGVFLFDDRAGYYHQGASVHSKLPAAHAYLWQAILEAKKRGCKEFNFWGVCDENDTQHPWFGLSKFKRGFGGQERNYLHVHDFPLTSKYSLNWAVEKYRRWRKGY